MADSKVTSVNTDFSGMTAAQMKAEVERIQAGKKKDALFLAFVATQNEGQVDDLLFEIYSNRRLLAPFAAAAKVAYDELQVIAPIGHKRVQFSEDEEKKYAARYEGRLADHTALKAAAKSTK